IYLEGGGACMSQHFCDHNPQNMTTVFPSGSLNGESFAGSLFTQAGLQAPYTTGIFDNTNPSNPFQTWNEIYIPYCTGDAHFGTNDDGGVEDTNTGMVTNPGQHFMGYRNMQKFISRIVPTFKSVDYVVLTGSSAGGLGAGLNYGLVQDTFGSTHVDLIDDSFPPFTGQLIASCLQGIVIPLWGMDKSIPADCAECQQDAGGLANIIVYWHHKYPKAHAGLISSIHDQIIRLFLAAGQPNPPPLSASPAVPCGDTDPNTLSNLALSGSDVPSFDGGMYENGLDGLRTLYGCTNVLSTYYIGSGDPDASDQNGTIDTLHEHLFRDRFYDPLAGPGKPSLAAWVGAFVQGNLSQTGP
ncbi:MAG: pectin acetylesterase-family hydrolase, partial [Polyangiaceae bacterium]